MVININRSQSTKAKHAIYPWLYKATNRPRYKGGKLLITTKKPSKLAEEMPERIIAFDD